MELNNKPAKRKSPGQSLSVLTQQKEQTSEISLYQDNAATEEDIAKALSFLNAMFTPQTEPAFLAMFARQVSQVNMTSRQLSDAVDLLARTNRYKSWSIADIVSYQAKVRTYTQNEVYKQTGQFPSPEYPKVKIGEREVLVSLKDAEAYHLEIVRDFKEYV